MLHGTVYNIIIIIIVIIFHEVGLAFIALEAETVEHKEEVAPAPQCVPHLRLDAGK